MGNARGFQVAAPFVCAAMLLTSCGGSDGANDDRRAQQPQTNAPEQPAQATVALSGCVEAAPGTNRFVLRNVRFEPRQGGDPQRDTTTPAAQGITEGAWVRLAGGDKDLTSFAGQRVTVTGTITDNGRNTIGAAGAAGQPNVSGDKSQAASAQHHSDKVQAEAGRIGRESMADGTAAEVRVTAVQGTGERCQLELKPEKR